MTSQLPSYQVVPEGWREGDPRAHGWDHPSIARVMSARWPEWAAVVTSTRPLGIFPLAPHIRSEAGHNLSMTFAYVLARAACGKTHLSLLDWGGALGHYALMARSLLPEVPIDATIKECAEVARVGQALVSDATFVTDDEVCFSRTYDLVIASSSLQYVADWRGMAGRLAKSATQWIFITRLPIVHRTKSFVGVQRPYGVGYQTEYISWVLNRDEFLAHMAGLGAVLEREFIAGENVQYAGWPEISEGAGFLFRAPAASADRFSVAREDRST